MDKTPAATEVLSTADLAKAGSVVAGLSDRLAGVTLSDNLGSPFQPDVLLRGFEASPVLGTPQGVAVYQNGTRINEAFGETVNWDLIPDLAIRRLNVISANPVFGLNALGGALVVEMKTGFTDPGGELQLSGGAFARRDLAAEFGASNGAFSAYVAARVLDEDGWRDFSPSHLRQAYADFGARSGRLSLDLSVTAADNRLFGQSAAPVQELAVDRSRVFTNPQENDNRLAFVTLNGAYAASDTVSLQGAAYFRGLRQGVINGNTTDATACGEGPDFGFLCQGDAATPLTDAAGHRLPDISRDGLAPIGQNDREHIRSDGLGGSIQATLTASVLGRANHLAFGASLDSAVTQFSSSVEVGVIDPSLAIVSSGLFVATPENTPFTATPVALRAASTYAGLYATDTFSLTERFAVTASGRYNHARIDLADRRGDALNGLSVYLRFNPALGATYRWGPGLTTYIGYAEGSRVPNASEIECSNPRVPCLLPSSLASDPPTLRQVVSHTWEAGMRGRLALGPGALSWKAGYVRTAVSDDIQAVSTSLSAGYFQNIAGTRREGVELGAAYRAARIGAFVSYGLVDATYRSTFDLPSATHPLRQGTGNIHVSPGDRLPGIPRHRLKLGADIEPRPGWTLGATLAWVGDQVYRGDESNQLQPLPAYVAVKLHANLDLTPRMAVFVTINNLLDARYATFGLLGDPTGVGAPGVPTDAAAVNPRFQSPAAPISAFGGIRLRF